MDDTIHINSPWDADHLYEGKVGVVYGLLLAVVMTEHCHGVETHPHCGEQHQHDGHQGDVPGHNNRLLGKWITTLINEEEYNWAIQSTFIPFSTCLCVLFFEISGSLYSSFLTSLGICILSQAGLVRLLKCVPEYLLVSCKFAWPKVLNLILNKCFYIMLYAWIVLKKYKKLETICARSV